MVIAPLLVVNVSWACTAAGSSSNEPSRQNWSRRHLVFMTNSRFQLIGFEAHFPNI
jgi:hypothetical protein